MAEIAEDPIVAWSEKMRRRFDREKAGLNLSDHRPGWSESWLLGKEIQGLTVGTLLRCVEDLKSYPSSGSRREVR